MEVVVTEEKKKIFRARKTMKISDRQQLEGLHTTLSTASSGLSNPSPPPLMNGTHKDDGPITGEKEQTNALESNSPNAASPDSPAPFLSLSLSPSPSSSQSPKAKEENPATPTSPFHSINFEMKTITEEEKDKNGPTSPSLNDPVSSTPTDSEESKEKDKVIEVDKKEEQKKTTPKTKDVVADSTKEPVKASASSSAQPPPISDRAEPVDTLNDTTETMDQETSTDTGKLEKLSVKSECSPMSSDGALKQEVKVNIKNDKDGDVKTPVREVMMEEKTKEEEMEVETTRKPSRPSSTPPSCTVAEETCSTSGLKRTLSEETKLDRNSVKREGKRPKMEFEAQLELKFSTKAGSHQKLEKIVQQLVEKHLKVLELTIFEKDFQELKERVDKIECASKHQTAINSLQAKIARLSKKFGEANQATENKKKQEALAAAANAAVSTAKMAPGANAQPQGVLRRQTVEPQPKMPREQVARSVDKMTVLSVQKKKVEEGKEMSHPITMAKKLTEYSEGKCRADIALRPISPVLEGILYLNCKKCLGNPRPDRYASYLFRALVPYDIYCDWVAKVNYVGLLGKDALPKNLRRTMRTYIEHRFPLLSCANWREIRDVINEILRVKRRPNFFQKCNGQTFEGADV